MSDTRREGGSTNYRSANSNLLGFNQDPEPKTNQYKLPRV